MLFCLHIRKYKQTCRMNFISVDAGHFWTCNFLLSPSKTPLKAIQNGFPANSVEPILGFFTWNSRWTLSPAFSHQFMNIFSTSSKSHSGGILTSKLAEKKSGITFVWTPPCSEQISKHTFQFSIFKFQIMFANKLVSHNKNVFISCLKFNDLQCFHTKNVNKLVIQNKNIRLFTFANKFLFQNIQSFDFWKT